MANATDVILRVKNEQLKSGFEESKAVVEDFKTSSESKLLSLAKIIGSVLAVKAVVSFGAQLVVEAQEASRATQVLGGIIEATGGAAGRTVEEMTALAEKLQEVTDFETETTQAAMGVMATFRNVKGDIFDEATEKAQDMAVALGGDLSGAAMQLGKALNDPAEGMNKLARSGVTFTKAQEDMVKQLQKSGDIEGAQRVILEELGKEFGGVARKAGEVSFEPFKNKLGDIRESIGEMIIGGIRMVMPSLMSGLNWIQGTIIPFWDDLFGQVGNAWSEHGSVVSEMVGLVVDYIGAGLSRGVAIVTAFGEMLYRVIAVPVTALINFISSTIVPAFGQVFDMLTAWWGEHVGSVTEATNKIAMQVAEGFAVVQGVFENFGGIAEIALLNFEYQVVKTFNEVTHFLTSTLPEAVTYFAEHWEEYFSAAAKFMGTVLSNMWGNLLEFMRGMKELLSGNSANFRFTALTDGLETTLTELPKYTPRIVGELEKQLKTELDAAAEQVGGSLNASIDKAMAANTETVNRKLIAPPEIEVKVKEPVIPPMKGKAKAEYDLDAPKEKEDKGQAASFEDIESSWKRIQSSIAGTRGEDAQVSALNANTEAVKPLADGLAATGDTLTKTNDRIAEQLAAIATNTANTVLRLDAANTLLSTANTLLAKLRPGLA